MPTEKLCQRCDDPFMTNSSAPHTVNYCPKCRKVIDKERNARWRTTHQEEHKHYLASYRQVNRAHVQKLARTKRQQNKLEFRNTLRGRIRAMLDNARASNRRQYGKQDMTTAYLYHLWEEQQGRCNLTGMPMDCIQGSFFCVSLDRISNDVGYLKGNVHLVCVWANLARNEKTVDEFSDFLYHFYRWWRDNSPPI